MKIVKYAKYVGTMIGPEGHDHRWTVPRKKSFNVPKKLTKSLVERLCHLKIYAISVLGFFGPYPHQTKQPSRLRHMPYNASRQDRTMPFQPTYDALALCVALDLRTHSSKAQRRFRQHVGYDLAPIFALSSDREEKFLILSMAHSTVVAFNTVRRSGPQWQT